MKIVLLKNDLAEALKKVLSAVDSKAVIPAMQGVLIKAFDKKLTVQGYNLELGIIATISEVAIAEEGEIVIEGKTFCDIISKSPDIKVEITTDDKGIVKIKSGKSRFKIVGISADNYPELPKIEEDFCVSFAKAEKLLSAIKAVEYACDEHFQKPIFTGILFKFDKTNLDIVSTDGKRMGLRIIPYPSEREYEAVIPKKALKEIIKNFSKEDKITFIFSKRNCCVKKDNFVILSRIIEGEFMDYNSVLPKNSKTIIKVNLEKLRDAADRLTLFNSGDLLNPAKINISDNNLKLNVSSSIGKIDDELALIKKTGEDVEIGINSRFLIECLKSIRDNEDDITINFNGSLSPTIIKPSEGETHLLVPMKLSK